MPASKPPAGIDEWSRAWDDEKYVSITRIAKGLYLGNWAAATDAETLKAYKIRDVICINVTPKTTADYATYKRNGIEHLYLYFEDDKTSNLLATFDLVTQRIALDLNKGKNVLVHCTAGISRSCTIVLAYLMRYKGMSLDQALTAVRAVRGFVNPNAGFLEQLHLWQNILRSIHTNNAPRR